jgi:predicted N-acetyltransferase YhbS
MFSSMYDSVYSWSTAPSTARGGMLQNPERGMSHTPRYLIEPLDTARHRREEFACESPELTDFLRKRARKEMVARASACFVLVAADDPGRIVGYYTLSQTAVTLRQIPEALARKLPRYPELGATLLGRLARDDAWRGEGIGSLLLIDALRRSARLSDEAGAVVVVTDPKDQRARDFYGEHGFQPLDDRRMFMPMKEIFEREAEGWSA